MPTPVDIVMPYGGTVVGDGTQYAKLAKPHGAFDLRRGGAK